MITVEKLDEAGLGSALYGLSLSYRPPGVKREDWWTISRNVRAYDVAVKKAKQDGGHNKFLEHIQVWISINANLEWWKQFDTYRAGVSKQSESTMHTLSGCEIISDLFDLSVEDFACGDDWDQYKEYLDMLNAQAPRTKSKALPQAFFQEREVNLNYKVIRHIGQQRFAHRLPDWRSFLEQVADQISNPEFIFDKKEGGLLVR